VAALPLSSISEPNGVSVGYMIMHHVDLHTIIHDIELLVYK